MTSRRRSPHEVRRIKDPLRAAGAAAEYLRSVRADAERDVAAAQDLRDTLVEKAFAIREDDGRARYTAADVARVTGLSKVAVGTRWPKQGGRRTRRKSFSRFTEQ